MNLWLDDVRNPLEHGAIGYIWVKTIQEAKDLLKQGGVVRASLDHDLGACNSCLAKWREASEPDAMPNCSHFGTGYDLCLWMAETGHWPAEPPVVHSLNPVGRERMRVVIDRYFPVKE